ncbi:hypothetical protein C3L33_17762, partial [Rhododendron williamsianum]
MEEETGKEKGGDKESPNNNNNSSSNQIHKESPAKKAKSCKDCDDNQLDPALHLSVSLLGMLFYSLLVAWFWSHLIGYAGYGDGEALLQKQRSITTVDDVVNKDDMPMFVLGNRIGDEGTSDTAGPECIVFMRTINGYRSPCFVTSTLYIVGVSEIEASREGRSLADFKYACVGYSIYSDRKGSSVDAQETQAELPICVGLEVLVDRKVNTAVDPVPAGVQNKEGSLATVTFAIWFEKIFATKRKYCLVNALTSYCHALETPKLACSLTVIIFSRNANVVAMGVAKNLRRVGNNIKDLLMTFYIHTEGVRSKIAGIIWYKRHQETKQEG